MSNTLPAAFIAQFDAEVKQAYQGMSRLMGTCRTRNGVNGSTHRFPKIGKGLAQPRVYQADVVPMNVAHTNATVTLEPWLAAEYTDLFAQAQVNFDERRELVKVVAGALGRRLDQLMIDDGLDVGVANTVAVGIGGNNAFNVAKMRAAKKILDANGVPTDNRHMAISATALQQLLGSTQATSFDFNSVKALVNGDINSYMGFNIHLIEDRDEGGLPLAGNTRKVYAWHHDAVGLAIGMNMETSIDYIAEKVSWLVCGKLLAGAINIDDEGIVEISIDESVEVNPA